MKNFILFLALLTSLFSSKVLGDFHLVETPGGLKKLVSAKHYTCNGIRHARATVSGSIGDHTLVVRGAALCGTKNLNLYKQPNGEYNAYTYKDNKLLATCSYDDGSGKFISNCKGFGGGPQTFHEKLYCQSKLCD